MINQKLIFENQIEKWFDCLCQDSQFKVSQHDFGHHLIFYNRMEIHFSTIINDA